MTTATHTRSAVESSLVSTNPTDSSNHFPFPCGPGIPYLWTSLNNFPPWLDSQPSLLSLTDSPSKESSFRPMTLLPRYNWPASLYSMSSQSTEYLVMLHWTVGQSSSLISSAASAQHLV